MEWKMEPEFKTRSNKPVQGDKFIRCSNLLVFNEVLNIPVKSKFLATKNPGVLVGVWKPKGSPSLLS